MGTTPADIVNRALDLMGRSDLVIGELGEGTEAAKPALRAYGPAMRQLLRAAHWSWARKQAPLTLLGDATGQTTGVSTVVQAPWTYKYAIPTDCMKARFLPWNSNPVSPNPPTMTGISQAPLSAVRLVPAPYLIGIDYEQPIQEGCYLSWDDIPDWANTPGEGPEQRTVIYTNVPPQPVGASSPTQYPSLVYTALVVYPSQWDSLFEEALVQYMMEKLAVALIPDRKFALSLRNTSMEMVKGIITQARAINANESGAPQTIARTAEWMRARVAGGGSMWGNGGIYGANGSGLGVLYGGFDGLAFSDGSIF